MPTLLASYNSSGCTGRCDARCHNAASPRWACDCICGGRYHGAGLDGTLEQKVREQGDEIFRVAKQAVEMAGCKLVADGFGDLFEGMQ